MSFDNKQTERAEMQAILEQSKIARPDDKLIGRALKADHVIVKLLGAGGMGLAYLGYDFLLGQKVVVKTLQSQFANHAEVRARFQQEAMMLEELKHPSVPHIKYIDRSTDPWMLVIEYCEGSPLSEFLHNKSETERKNRGFQKSLLRAMFGIIDALAMAHHYGIIHRDVKPDNLMVQTGPNGELFIKLLDFGIAKAVRGVEVKTQYGSILGTPGYLAPEQMMDRPITKATDIYSLGAVMFEVFAGYPFIEPDENNLIMTAKTMNPLYGPDRLKIIPIHIRAMLSMMLAMEAADRFGGMYEVEGALRFVMSQMDIEDRRILESEVQEMKLLTELTTSSQIEGKLELIGAQRVLSKQFELKRQDVMVTGRMAAIQDPQAAAMQHQLGQAPAAQAQSSIDIPLGDSMLGGGSVNSSPDYRLSDIRLAAAGTPAQFEGHQVPAVSAVQGPVVSITAEPSSGGTIHGIAGPASLLAAQPVQVLQPLPAAQPVQASLPPLASAETRHLPPRDEAQVSQQTATAQTVIAPATTEEDSRQKVKFLRFVVVALSATLGFFVLLLFIYKITADKKEKGTKPAQDKVATAMNDAAVPATKQPSDSSVRIPPDATVQYDASATPAPVAKSFEDTYKALEETCKKSEKGQKFWATVPNFRAYCVKTEAFKIEKLELQVDVLRHNKKKYCNPYLKPYEKAQPKECASHDYWIKNVVDRIWARDHPDWKPPAKTTPSRATNAQKPSTSKPRR